MLNITARFKIRYCTIQICCAEISRIQILIVVALLNVSINALLLSFASIASDVAFYFENTPSDVDLLTSVGFGLSLPVCIINTWLSDRFGLR